MSTSTPIIRLLCILAIALSVVNSAQAQQADEARAMLVRANEARATWDGFPGFEAELTVFEDGKMTQGKLTVAANGLMKVELADSFPWVEPKLESLISHRMAGDGASHDAEFADGDSQHPLGRLIRLNDDAAMGSMFRVQDDVIREVHRTTPTVRFIITVLDVERNSDGRVLPSFYTVNFWDAKSGNIQSTSVVQDTWVRIGKWDLPKVIRAVESSEGNKQVVREIRFTDHKLMSDIASTNR